MSIQIMPKDVIRVEDYLISVDTYTLLGLMEYKNKAEWIIRLSLLNKTSDGYLFKKNVLKFAQTNNRGYNAWDEDMVWLKSELIFRTDINGRLLHIENWEDVLLKWQKLKPVLFKKHRHLAQIDVIIDSIDHVFASESRFKELTFGAMDNNLLFPGIYGSFKNEQDIQLQNKVLPAFIGTLGLPLQLNVELKSYDHYTDACKIIKTGRIDHEKYPGHEVAALLRAMTDQFNLSAENIQFAHVENYEFDEKHWLKAAGQVTRYEFPGILKSNTIGYAYTINDKKPEVINNNWTLPLRQFIN